MSRSSNSCLKPRPRQSGQAPNGLLKENARGSNSSMVKPHSGQANLVENVVSSLPSCTTTRPSASFRAISTLSARRLLISGLTTMRSTITLMLCLLFFSSLISSSKVYTLPSTITRTKPCFFSWSNSFWCSPFLPRTTGAKICNLVPCG